MLPRETLYQPSPQNRTLVAKLSFSPKLMGLAHCWCFLDHSLSRGFCIVLSSIPGLCSLDGRRLPFLPQLATRSFVGTARCPLRGEPLVQNYLVTHALMFAHQASHGQRAAMLSEIPSSPLSSWTIPQGFVLGQTIINSLLKASWSQLPLLHPSFIYLS